MQKAVNFSPKRDTDTDSVSFLFSLSFFSFLYIVYSPSLPLQCVTVADDFLAGENSFTDDRRRPVALAL